MPSRPRLLAAAALLAGAASVAPAQQGAADPRCPPGTLGTTAQITQDACQKAVDLFNFMAPQLGVAITGGNAVLGGSGTLGGLGHFSVGLRANALIGQLPQPENITLSVTGAQRSEFAPQRQILGLPTADAAVGIFKGIPLGVTNVLGVDALVSAFYVPDVEEEDVSVSTRGGAVKFGYGARVGILQETAIVPGVSVSYLRRDLPTVDLVARVNRGDSVRVTGLETQTEAWRLVAGKRFLFLGLSAGVGRDIYESRTNVGAYVAPRTGTIAGIGFQTSAVNYTGPTVTQRMTRTNVFADASLNFPFFRLVGEIGRVTGGEVPESYNSFGDRRADDPYTYGSIGLRLQF